MSKKLIEYIKNNWEATLRYHPEDEDTLIGLPKPYTVPSIRNKFQELYYWDTYFTNVGLILSGRVEYAKNNIENIAYLIERYGYMLNGNRTYYLNRSQPPFFSHMVKDVYEVILDKGWLNHMYRIAVKEYEFWQTLRQTNCGLNRYYGFMEKSDVETLVAHVERRLKITCSEEKEERVKMAEAGVTFFESGWDCNSRFGMRPQEYAWIDLNCLLYGMEKNLSFFASELGIKNDWEDKAEHRKALLNELCWNEKMGMFADYDYINKTMTDFVSDASFYAMFVKLCTPEQAASTVKLLEKVECEYGIAACEKRDDLMQLQWDYPIGWACLHFIIIQGLRNYGYYKEAERIARKYCTLVENNYEKTGNVWEKYNVVTGEVASTKEGGLAAMMMGWSAGIYLYAKENCGKE
ncbi:MAG: hypothetical protein IKK03_14655 [Lachnospiraceae bacterium]|nr:hypothetical protein [Lachnospiraceae bacterium]